MLRAASLFAAIACLAGTLTVPAEAKVTVSISCSSLGIEMELCRTGAQAWAKKTGNEVNLVSTPADANERLGLYQSLLAAHSTDVDIFQIDAVWPGILANDFLDLNQFIKPDDQDDYSPSLIQNDTVNGKLIALPWFVDTGLLYYRKDLLDKYHRKVPQTWAELEETAKAVTAGEGSGMQGYVWQGRAYEGLTCNALEWIASSGGGTIIGKDGQVTVSNAQAAAAIDRARGWIGTISPEGVLNYDEEGARGVFQSGKAVFMRNWPYAWALANTGDSPVKDKVGEAPLPHGDGANSVGVLGGQSLAVSRYSKHPQEAVDLILYLAGKDEEKRRWKKGAFNPTLKPLYEDPDLKNDPMVAVFSQVLNNVVARPSTITGRRYNQVSSDFVQAVHAALSGQGSGADNLAKLNDTLTQLSRGGHWQ
ncbi:MAG TPA: ABC transporter substrate-binding protein [Dongiaceae bacterium]